VKNNVFWQLNIGQLIPVFFMIGTIFILYGKLSTMINSHESRIEEIRRAQLELVSKKLPEINEKIVKIDSNIEWIRSYINRKDRAASNFNQDSGLVSYPRNKTVFD
jgi:hypothetical protein